MPLHQKKLTKIHLHTLSTSVLVFRSISLTAFVSSPPEYLTMRTLLRCLVFWTIINSSYNRNSRNQKQKPTKDPDKPGDISILNWEWLIIALIKS